MITKINTTIFLITVVSLVGCSGSQVLDPEVKTLIDQKIAQITTQACQKDGCKDFKIICSPKQAVDAADRANGITNKQYVVISWLRLGGNPIFGNMFDGGSNDQWYEKKETASLIKVNGSWKIKQFGVFDSDYICRM